MNAIHAAVLGAVQGLTEFLPVSSSGHLLIARGLMGIGAQSGEYMLFDVLLHVGTLLALLIAFWKDWMHMLCHPIKDRTLILLVIASIPSLIPVVFLKKWVSFFENGWMIGLSLLLTAVCLFIAERIDRHRRKASDSVGVINALAMGFMQMMKLILGPGASRSGATISGGIASGLSKKAAARFAFMMSAPAVLASFVYEGKEAYEAGLLREFDAMPVIIGIAAAAVVGCLTIRVMLRLLEKLSLDWFALYLALLGTAILFVQICDAGARFGIPDFLIPEL